MKLVKLSEIEENVKKPIKTESKKKEKVKIPETLKSLSESQAKATLPTSKTIPNGSIHEVYAQEGVYVFESVAGENFTTWSLVEFIKYKSNIGRPPKQSEAVKVVNQVVEIHSDEELNKISKITDLEHTESFIDDFGVSIPIFKKPQNKKRGK